MSIEGLEIPTTKRPSRKIVLAAQVDSSDSDRESRTEQADLPVRKCRHERENSDDEFDVPFMERRLVTRSRTAIIQKQACKVGLAAYPLTGTISHRGDRHNVEGVANRSTGREVNVDIQVWQTSVGLNKVETHTGL